MMFTWASLILKMWHFKLLEPDVFLSSSSSIPSLVFTSFTRSRASRCPPWNVGRWAAQTCLLCRISWGSYCLFLFSDEKTGLSPATCHGPQFRYHKSFCEGCSPWRSLWWCRDKRIFPYLGCPLCRVRWKASMALSDGSWLALWVYFDVQPAVRVFCKGCLFLHNMIVRERLSAAINIGCLLGQHVVVDSFVL